MKRIKFISVLVFVVCCSMSCGPKIDEEHLAETIRFSESDMTSHFAYLHFLRFRQDLPDNLTEKQKNYLDLVGRQIKDNALRDYVKWTEYCTLNEMCMDEYSPIELMEAAYEKGRNWNIGIEVGARKGDVEVLVEALDSLVLRSVIDSLILGPSYRCSRFAVYYVFALCRHDLMNNLSIEDFGLISSKFDVALANASKDDPGFLSRYEEAVESLFQYDAEENIRELVRRRKSLTENVGTTSDKDFRSERRTRNFILVTTISSALIYFVANSRTWQPSRKKKNLDKISRVICCVVICVGGMIICFELFNGLSFLIGLFIMIFAVIVHALVSDNEFSRKRLELKIRTREQYASEENAFKDALKNLKDLYKKLPKDRKFSPLEEETVNELVLKLSEAYRSLRTKQHAIELSYLDRPLSVDLYAILAVYNDVLPEYMPVISQNIAILKDQNRNTQ